MVTYLFSRILCVISAALCLIWGMLPSGFRNLVEDLFGNLSYSSSYELESFDGVLFVDSTVELADTDRIYIENGDEDEINYAYAYIEDYGDVRLGTICNFADYDAWETEEGKNAIQGTIYYIPSDEDVILAVYLLQMDDDGVYFEPKDPAGVLNVDAMARGDETWTLDIEEFDAWINLEPAAAVRSAVITEYDEEGRILARRTITIEQAEEEWQYVIQDDTAEIQIERLLADGTTEEIQVIDPAEESYFTLLTEEGGRFLTPIEMWLNTESELEW